MTAPPSHATSSIADLRLARTRLSVISPPEVGGSCQRRLALELDVACPPPRGRSA